VTLCISLTNITLFLFFYFGITMKDEGNQKTKMDLLVDVAIVARGGEKEQEDGVTLSGLGHSPILNKAKVHRVKFILFFFCGEIYFYLFI